MAVQINVAANQAALMASIQAGVQAYNQKFAQNNQLNLSVNQRAFSQPLGRITGDVKDFEAALAASNARVIAFGASTAVLGGVIRSFKELAIATIEVEKNLTDINRVFGLTTSQLQKFSIELFNVSKTTATSFNEASKAALEFSRQGLKAEDTLQRTKDALTLTRLAGISTANAVDALTSTVNGFAATGVTTTQILNKLVAVEQDYAVGAGDLAEALSRTGQAAQEAGVSLDQLNALVTAAQQSTARGGAVIGNALKTIFTRLQRTDTLDQLEAFNISVRDVQGNILPAVQILQNFANAYRGLADAQRAQLSEQVAGVYQVNILKAIVTDLNKSQGVYAGALQRGASATNEAEIATAKLNKTLDALLTQTGIATQQLATNIGKVTFEPLAKYGADQLKSFVESLNELLEGEGVGSTFANGFLKGIRNIIAGPGAIAAFFTLFKLIQNSFTYLTQALPQIAGITTESQNRKNIEASILQILQQQGPISQALAGSMGNQAAQAQLLLQLARQQTAEFQQQTALAKNLAATLSSQGVAVKGGRGLQVTRASGYIPNATKIAEVVGAKAGGYTPGRVVPAPVGGVMNTAEDVKYIPGFAQPFINPPANSKAGRAHRKNSIDRTGVDPYMSHGFIPNFGKINQTDYKISYPSKLIKNPNQLNSSYQIDLNRVTTYELGAEKDLDIDSKIVDVGLNNKTGKPNGIYDLISGRIEVIKYLNKDEVDNAVNTSWDGLFSGNNTWRNNPIFNQLGISNSLIDAAFNQTLAKVGFTKKDIQYKIAASQDDNLAKTNKLYRFKSGPNKDKLINTKEGFAKSLQGDKSNYIGSFYENLIEQHPNVNGAYIINTDPTAPADLIPKTNFTRYKGIEVKNTGIKLDQAIKKALRIGASLNANDLRDQNVTIPTLPIYQPYGVGLNASQGFIPNFAPPTSAIRIPWFKKFANPSFDAIQPALGISKASDVDTFRQVNFKSTAEGADERGDSNIFAPLFEDFAFKAMQLVSQQDVKDDLIRGYVLQPGTNQKQSALDAALKKAGIGIEYKGYPKKNLTGSITGELTRKYQSLSKTNPEEAAKLKELIIAFNEVGHENQITSELGKKLFSPLAGTSYSEMVKNSPDLVKGLSAETNSLLNSYVKNPAFLAMSAAKGFIPNFADSLGSNASLMRQALGLMPFVVDLKRGTYAEGDMFHYEIANKKFLNPETKKPIYGNLGPDDIHGSTYADTFVRGFYNASSGKVDFELTETQKKDKNFMKKNSMLLDKVKARYADRFKSSIPVKAKRVSPLSAFRNDGFIPNFADPKYISETLKRIKAGTSGFSAQEQQEFLSKFGAEKTLVASKQQVLKSRMLMSRMVDKLGLDYINSRSVDQLNKDVKNGYMSGALNFDVPENLSFIAARGFIPNFALPIMKGYAFNNTGKIYNDVYHSDAWDSIEGSTAGAIKYAYHNGKLLLQTNKTISPELKKNFLSRGIPESAFSPVEDVDSMMRSKNTQEINDKLKNLGAVQLSSGIKAIFQRGLYTKLIKDQQSYNIPGGLSPKDLEIFGGVDGWIKYTEKNYGPLKWNALAKGFVPNFADFIDVDTLTKNSIHYSGDLAKLIKDIESSIGRNLSSGELRFLSSPKTDLSKLNDPKILNRFINSERKGGFAQFAKGFIPNFNLIKGRNSFQKNWLVETAKKRNLNLNDPDVFSKLATEFAKIYPNSQGMFGLSGGFIPNFAYKQAVMGLEESMSGNKAIFDTKPFPHIRNSSQPTFSSAIADHGGLGNALSDSMRGQKAAGLMNKGFIPNFVRTRQRNPRVSGNLQLETMDPSVVGSPSGSPVLPSNLKKNLIKSVNDVIKEYSDGAINQEELNKRIKSLSSRYQLTQESQEKLQNSVNKQTAAVNNNQSKYEKFGKSLSSASTAISLAGPMIAGLAEQTFFGNKKRTDMTSTERQVQSGLSTGLTAISTGAGIGAAFGPLGAGIGAAAGALVGLTSALNAATLSAEELAQLNDEQTQKAQANITVASSYVEAQKSLTDMIAKGASSTEIETATKNLANNFSQIKDTKLQEMFLSAGGDVSIMTKQLQDYTNEVTKESAKKSGLYGANLKPEERASALSIGLGKEGSSNFIKEYRKSLKKATIEAQFYAEKYSDTTDLEEQLNFFKNQRFTSLAESMVPQNEPERESKVKALTENFLNKNFEEVLKGLEKNISISDIFKTFSNFNKVATESYSAIFERIANNLQKQNFDLERRFISATGENKIQNTILEFSTGFNSFLDSFLSDTLDEFSKLQMAPQVAQRKYTEGLSRIQLNNNKFQIDQEKAKNDFLEKNASKLTDTFKSSILQSQQNAQYFETQLLPQIQKGDYSFDLTSVLNDLNQQNLKQAKQTIAQSNVEGLDKLDLKSTTGRESAIKILTEKSKTLGDNAEEAAKKIFTAINAINSLSKSAEFLTNINVQKTVQSSIDLAKQEKINFDANQKYLEEENRIRSSFEAARLKAETQLSIQRADVDKGILLRLRAMRELVDELQVRSAISAARGSAQAQLTEARVQDPFRILGKGIRSNTEETIRLENQAIQERRKVEDATLNDQIQQAAIEIATREANTSALQGLTDAVFELTNNILMQQMGGQSNYENIKSFQNSYSAIPISPEDKNAIYTPEQISAFKAYQQLQQQRPSSLGGYDYSQYKKDLLGVNPKNELNKQQISDITGNFKSRAEQLGVSQSETDQLMQDQQTLSIYQQLETIRNKALQSKTKESDKIAEDARALQNRLIKEKDILDIQRAVGDQIKKNADEYKRMQSTFSGNFVIGVANLRTQSEEIINNLGRDLPRMFGDGLVDGIKAAIRESDNLGDALMGVASKFLDEISTALMRSSIYGILGNIGMGIPGISNAAAAGGMKQKGGYIRAQSGMYISGTGSGDKYPALLENGEYVLNRKAVMAMGGPAALDTLNFSAAPRFAAGGSFGNNFDNISSMESNMTTYGLEQSQLYNELRDSERQKQQEAIRKRQQRKAERNAMIGSIIAAVATAAIAAGVSNVASNVKATNAQKLSAKVQATGGAGMTNSEMGKLASYQKSGLLGKNFEYIGGTPQTGFASIFSGPTIGKTWYQKAGASISKPFGRRQTGGYIGSRLSDTIPTYATGGLVENPIVKRYAGGGNVGGQRINNGAGNTSTVNNNTNASNSFNFNTTVQRDGKIEIGSNMTSYTQQDVELSQSLNTKVYEVVLDTIRKEKRFGGSLAGTRNA